VIRLSSVLASLLVVCALALVTSQHKARKLFSELAQEQEAARRIEVEWGQLQLEQSTWAMHARIEKIASGRLQMRLPLAARVRVVSTEAVGYAAGTGSRADAANGTRRSGAHASEPTRPGLKR
jgi:cell division protein FtsL